MVKSAAKILVSAYYIINLKEQTIVTLCLVKLDKYIVLLIYFIFAYFSSKLTKDPQW